MPKGLSRRDSVKPGQLGQQYQRQEWARVCIASAFLVQTHLQQHGSKEPGYGNEEVFLERTCYLQLGRNAAIVMQEAWLPKH